MNGPARFETTEWSVVLAARDRGSPQAEEALARLCQRYWYPVYSYIRRQGSSPEDAADLTQGFFARLIEKEDLRQVDRERGRFRAFVLAACRHYLANARDHDRAAKRGGGRPLLSIDAGTAEDRLRLEPRHDLTPEKEFLRRWTLTVIDQSLCALRDELDGQGKGPLFESLKSFLIGEAGDDSCARAAREQGSTEGAVRVAVHRLRKRFRARLREEIARTVEDEAAVDDELKSLLASL
jgi:RNA polymerase sigma-70 factor (ECF subfamily)